MSKAIFSQAVSLGPTCRTKYQMQRVFGWRAGARGVFDWQLTPVPAIIEYLERDFRGVFERADLQITNGVVNNARFRTNHKHMFSPKLTTELLDKAYPGVRQSHERWCDFTRAAISGRVPTVFLLGEPIAPAGLVEIERAVAKRRRGPFRIVPAPADDTGTTWVGDSEAWTRHLDQFEIAPPPRVRASYRVHQLRKRVRQLLGEPQRESIHALITRLEAEAETGYSPALPISGAPGTFIPNT